MKGRDEGRDGLDTWHMTIQTRNATRTVIIFWILGRRGQAFGGSGCTRLWGNLRIRLCQGTEEKYLTLVHSQTFSLQHVIASFTDPKALDQSSSFLITTDGELAPLCHCSVLILLLLPILNFPVRPFHYPLIP